MKEKLKNAAFPAASMLMLIPIVFLMGKALSSVRIGRPSTYIWALAAAGLFISAASLAFLTAAWIIYSMKENRKKDDREDRV